MICDILALQWGGEDEHAAVHVVEVGLFVLGVGLVVWAVGLVVVVVQTLQVGGPGTIW